MTEQPSRLFLEIIQQHEREWGTDSYPERPALADLLSKPVVAIWVSTDKTDKKAKGSMFSVHDSSESLDEAVHASATVGKPSIWYNRKLARVFINQEMIEFKVKLIEATEGHQG